MSITEERGGKILLRCHAGCPQQAVIAALQARELWPRADAVRIVDKMEVVGRFDYRDAAGELIYQVERLEAPGHKLNGVKRKRFRARRSNGNGGWVYNLNGTTRVLYRLPELSAAGPEVPVFVAEGERKVDRLLGLGLLATCNPGGAGKWRPEYAQALRGRHVIILPDQDAPGRAHAEQVARSVADIAASVKLVALPSLAEHGDVVDWLAAGGTRELLERLVAAAPIWTAPPVGTPALDGTLAALPPLNRDELDREIDRVIEASRDSDTWSFRRIGSDFRFTFPDGARIDVRRVHRRGDGLSAEVLVVTRAHGRLHFGTLSLSSTASQESLVRRLDRRAPGLTWDHHIEAACFTVAQEVRRGEPEIRAADILPMRLQYAITPFVFFDETNVLYGPGGTGKSAIAQALAVAVAAGVALPGGLVPQPEIVGPALFLDYETTAATFRRRVETIADALGAGPNVTEQLWYRRMAVPIADDIETVREIADRRGVRLVVVDSWRLATGVVGGGDPADATIRAMEALRTLSRTTLIIGHSPKNREGDEHPSLYGSIFGTNLPRSVVFVKRLGDASGPEAHLVLQQVKSNEGLVPPIGLTFRYGMDDTWGSRIVDIESHDLSAEPEAQIGTWQRIKATLLLERRKMSVRELAEAIGVASTGSIRAELSRHRIEIGSESVPDGAKGEKLWFLLPPNQEMSE